MNFEQMKVIWDAQSQRPLYAVDEAALHAGIRSVSRRFQHLVVLSHAAVAATWVALAAFYLAAPLMDGEHLHRLGSAALLLSIAAGQLVALARRRRGETEFDESVRGELERAIWRIDHDVGWARSLRRGYVPLFLLAISIDLAFRLTPAIAVVWAGTVALVVGASWALDGEIRSVYLPRKRRYETIRATLVEAER